MLSLALPKGSDLERPILALFEAAGLGVRRASERSYRAAIEYGGRIEVAFYKPREIPPAVESGAFDCGVTGTDWIEETGAKVELVAAFAAAVSWRLVLAVPAAHQGQPVAGIRVATEYPRIARHHFESVRLPARVVHSFGAGEAKIPELADAVIEADGSGCALAHNDMRVIGTVRTCVPQLIAGPAAWRDAGRRTTIQNVARLLGSVEAGAAHVLLTVRVPARDLPGVVGSMPRRSWRAGTGLADDDLVVVQGLAARLSLAETVGNLLAAGAVDVIESPLTKAATPCGAE
jgi:ATP phosphoribosyltransferase